VLWAVLSCGLAAGAGEIRWLSGPAQVPARSAAESEQALGELAARTSARHIVVQFKQPPSRGQRAGLESAGLTLLSSVGDHAFFAALSPQIDARRASAALGGAAISAIQRSWKLHPDLDRGIIREWSVVSAGKGGAGGADVVVAAYVLFHPDVRLDPEALRTARRHGALVRSRLESINGLVIELPFGSIPALADEDGVMWIEPPLPRFSEVNNDNRQRTGANVVQAAPYGLDGSGVTVMVYDGGEALASHEDFGGRLTVRDTSGLSDHATHVCGTIGGDGAGSSGLYRGMAPGVLIESYGFEQEGGLQPGFLYTDPGDLEDDYDEAINVFGADISNNSIGTNTAPNGFPCDWEGNYGATSALIDAIAGGSLGAPFRIVWANGNERQTSTCFGVEGFPGEYHTTAPPACAKNHITVGALNSNDDSVTDFTSWGPCDDGRLKPDLSAPGCQSNDDFDVTSCSSSGGYTGKCGTSMASPTVCGLSALLLQDYRAQYPDTADFRNSTLKVLLAHTAVDLENPGPDYMTGYGSVRIEPAVELLRSGSFLEGVIDQGQTVSVLAVVNPGEGPLKVTLAWDDAPAAPNVTPVLVNDLDLRVFDSASTQYYPWTLSQLDPAADAVRTQADHVNNIEQVVIDAPAPGVYRVDIHGFNVAQGPQSFSVCASPLLVACSSAGTVSLDRPKYGCSSSATIRLVDCDLNTDDGVAETYALTMTSTSQPAGEVVTLTETQAETAAFEGVITLASASRAGLLLVADGDQLAVSYTDADDGQGGSGVVVTAQAVVDCVSPLISAIQATDVEPRSATITFTTDELAAGEVRYGERCGALSLIAVESGFKTSHAIDMADLEDSTPYFYEVRAVDQAGNPTIDDNGGSCHTFTTPEVPDFFTEQFGDDNDLDHRTILFTPVAGVDHYAACAEPVTVLPTDPAGGTILSLADDQSQMVTLSGGATVELYGVTYGSLFVSSNGYVTFGSGDSDYTESLAEHFELPRIAALYDDLTPPQGGTVSWRQLADRAAVTWLNVTEYNGSNQNTLQIEMYFNGDIRITCLNIAASDGIAGLSEGQGLSPDYLETDLSEADSCGPQPPQAWDLGVVVEENSLTTITLPASDDGLPDPPGALATIITALPQEELRDAGNGLNITSVPYVLSGGGNQVIYATSVFSGLDSFEFKVHDGGAPPEGGESGVATVSITVGGPQPIYEFLVDDSNPGWSTTGQWAFGQPAGEGGDPSAGRTGDNVLGYNLAGHYTNNMPEHYLTSGPLDCTDLADVEVRYWRWLGVEQAAYDHARFQVSTNGTAWTTMWQNPAGSGTTMEESEWTQHSYDISALADGQPAVYLRWVMGSTDISVVYHGWNLDDIQVWAVDESVECAVTADCADLDGNAIRDDNCVWWDCQAGACLGTAVPFADMGGEFGACAPDGFADANDRFHTLNCFADTSTDGGPDYPCEPNPPSAFNVDAGGEFGSCAPDGVCDAHDAFAALNAFSGFSSCTCPSGPAPDVPAKPVVVGQARLLVQPRRPDIRQGDLVAVDVLIEDPLPDLRGYQLHAEARGTGRSRGSLDLIDVAVEPGHGSVFEGQGDWRAFNVRTAQMLAGLDGAGIAAPPGAYLATFTFRASIDAQGSFEVDLLHDSPDRTQRTFLVPTPPTGRIDVSTTPALIEVGSRRGR
jgi:hypothetical protein